MNTTQDILGVSQSTDLSLALRAAGRGAPPVDRGPNPLAGTGSVDRVFGIPVG